MKKIYIKSFFIGLQNIHGYLNKVYFFQDIFEYGQHVSLLFIHLPKRWSSCCLTLHGAIDNNLPFILLALTEACGSAKKCFAVPISWYSNCSVNSNFVCNVDLAYINEIKAFVF